MKTHKVCTKCKVNKPLDEYSKRKNVPDGRKSACNVCRQLDVKKYYNKNKEKESIRKQKYYEENKEHIIKRSGNYNIQRRKTDPLFKVKHNMLR